MSVPQEDITIHHYLIFYTQIIMKVFVKCFHPVCKYVYVVLNRTLYCFKNNIESSTFWFDRGFGFSMIHQHNSTVKTTMPSLSVLKDDDLVKELKNSWKMDFTDEDWKHFCIKVMKKLSAKKYKSDDVLLKHMNKIIDTEVCLCFYSCSKENILCFMFETGG